MFIRNSKRWTFVFFLLVQIFSVEVLSLRRVSEEREKDDGSRRKEDVSLNVENKEGFPLGDAVNFRANLDGSTEDNNNNIKSILEENYKFKNDGTSTRFKISTDDREDPIGGREDLSREGDDFNKGLSAAYPEVQGESKLVWAFRSYAVRRIVGGMETSISMYPYNVAISRSGRHWCGGSIIDEQWVLTAGHCMESASDGDKRKLSPFIVRAGSSFHNKGGYQAKLNKAFFPAGYIPGNADYDFCLLRLDRPMPIGRNIAVLNLPATDYVIKKDDILIVTGWGSTDESGFGHIPDRIRFVPVPVMKEEDCQKSYRFYITPRMICAGYATGGKDACNHDSGGPAVRDGVLLGVVSFGGKRCGDPRSPGVYSRVSTVTNWVDRTISKNEASSVPELREKIQKAREREEELQKLKSRVEDKKNKIKDWLRETLKSPSFIELARKKLKLHGLRKQLFRRTNDFTDQFMDDRTIDDVNLSYQINERILGYDSDNETEKLISTLAVQEVMMGSSEHFDKTLRADFPVFSESDSSSIERLFSFVTEE